MGEGVCIICSSRGSRRVVTPRGTTTQHAASTPPRRGRHTSATSPHLGLLQHPLDEDPVAQGDELAQLGACLQRGDGGRRVSEGTPLNRGAAAASARATWERMEPPQEGRQKRGGGVMGAHHPHHSLTHTIHHHPRGRWQPHLRAERGTALPDLDPNACPTRFFFCLSRARPPAPLHTPAVSHSPFSNLSTCRHR